MIVVHRLAHDDEPIYLNPDLIQWIEETPDTVITLTSGVKVVVSDSPDELVGRVRAYRVGMLAEALNGRGPRSITRAEI
jgi:flagellar protein FlbD